MKKIFLSFVVTALVASTTFAQNKTHTKGLRKNSAKAIEAVDEADFDAERIKKLPTKFALQGPPILNQGETSKCLGYALGYYIMSMYNGGTAPNSPKATSPDFLYALCKKENKNDKELGNCKEGCIYFTDPEDGAIGAVDILMKYGMATLEKVPINESSACTVISNDDIASAASNKIKGYYKIDKKSYTNPKEIKSWLYAGYPLFICVDCDTTFNDLEEDDVWTSKSNVEKGEGLHAMALVGYDDTKKAYKVANSWGDDFGDHGFAWIGYDFMAELLGEPNTAIGFINPNERQRINMGKASSVTCGNAKWGDILVVNKADEEVVEMFGTNYTNDNEGTFSPNDKQLYTGIPSGNIAVKIYNADKSKFLKEYKIVVSSCKETVITLEDLDNDKDDDGKNDN